MGDRLVFRNTDWAFDRSQHWERVPIPVPRTAKFWFIWKELPSDMAEISFCRILMGPS
jgi:hypothetical protein